MREHGTDSAMFRSLNPKPFNLRISRYLVIILTLLKMNLRISAHTFILIRSRVWLNDAGRTAHSKTERWLTSTGQVAQNHPDYSQAVRLKRPVTTITSENAGLLQFLDAVFHAEKYSELSNSDTGILLKNYAKQRNYSKELLSSVLSGITGSAAIKLIEWGIIYEFTS